MSVDEEGQMSSETVQVDLMTTKLATMNDILAAVEVDPKVGVDLLMTPSSREKNQTAVGNAELSGISNDNVSQLERTQNSETPQPANGSRQQQ